MRELWREERPEAAITDGAYPAEATHIRQRKHAHEMA